MFAKQLQAYTTLFEAEHKKTFSSDQSQAQVQDSSTSTPTSCTHTKELAFASFHQVCANKTFMMQSLFHMNLDAAAEMDTLKYEGVIFRITDFPHRVQTTDVLQAFSRAVGSKIEGWVTVIVIIIAIIVMYRPHCMYTLPQQSHIV